MHYISLHTNSFKELGGSLLVVHKDFKFLVEYFKPYIIGDIIFHKNKYIGVINTYLTSKSFMKIYCRMQQQVNKQHSRISKLTISTVRHNYNYQGYTKLINGIHLVVDDHTLYGLQDYLYTELYIRNLDNLGDTYVDITVTDTMSTK